MDDLFNAASRMLNGARSEGDASASNEDSKWLNMSQELYRTSTDYYESEMRSKWEHSIALFRSKHAPGSKYYSDAYKHRSKLFRPKTRINVRKHEAACAAAFFSTSDVASVEPGDDNDEWQQATADIIQELLNIRLGHREFGWFLTLIGAYQNTMVQGAVASKQYWDYAEDEYSDSNIIDSSTQKPVKRVRILRDKPKVDLIPLENLRFDPSASWINTAQESPYLIHLIPMTAGDVLAKMEEVDEKTGQPKWKPMELADVLRHGTATQEQNTTRKARRGTQRDETDLSNGNEFSTVWVREYIVRTKGKDMIWYTLGDSKMLTDPVPLEEVYLHGRPIVIGYSMLEAFNPLPDSMVYVSKDLQAKANDVDNQRFDNVRQVLNKRYFIRRGARIDQKALYRNVPGGSVVMSDPNKDIRWDNPGDVTGSSYQEQDRTNIDFDELTGSFSQGSVMSNRKLNETVGGMNLMNSSADAVTEYQIRVFAETWVEPVMNQLALLEQKYETDEMILGVAAGKAELFQKYGIDRMYTGLMDNEVTVRVNVGMGATDPMKRVERFQIGLNTVAQIPSVAQRINGDEIIKEVFGRLGYKDGMRFFIPEEEMQPPQPPPDPRLEVENLRQQSEAEKRNLDAWKFAQKVKSDRQEQLDNAKVEMTKVMIQERNKRLAELNKQQELEFKLTTGRQGI